MLRPRPGQVLPPPLHLAPETLPSPARTSGTETPEMHSTLSPLHVFTNGAAPCGIPRGLSVGDRVKVRRSKDLASSCP